jgi:small subunit ribosomal protein S2
MAKKEESKVDKAGSSKDEGNKASSFRDEGNKASSFRDEGNRTEEEKKKKLAEIEARAKALMPIEAKEKEFEVEFDVFQEQTKKPDEDAKELTEEDLKIKEELKKDKTILLPLDDYVRSGIHLGTKVITPDMRKYVYRRRADGLAVLNTELIDKKLREVCEFVNKFKPENIIVACKRDAGWKAVNLFSKLLGIKVFTKKYPAGILTNLTLPNFMETELVIVCDPWLDKNALKDSIRVNKQLLALCDTNNIARDASMIMPCNNKGNKSLGLVFYVLAREYIKHHKLDVKLPGIEEFMGEKFEDMPVREKKVRKKEVSSLEADKAKLEERMRALTEGEAKEGV